MILQQLAQSRWGRLLAVLVVCGSSFFIHGDAPAVSLMESRNFVAAREMVAGGSWLIPTMNGELRLAKPPLPTWAVAAVQLFTGPTADLGLLRLPAALAATLLVLFFWGLVRELTRHQPAEGAAPGRTAWLAALVLASSLLVITTGREGQWDIFANSLLIGGVWLLVRGWQRVGAGTGSLFGAGVLVGLAMLSKGPVPLYGILVPFLGAYLLGQPRHRQVVRQHTAATMLAVLVALVVGLSWPVYVWAHVAPVARAVARTEVSSWADRHVQPFWYYWSFFAFTGLWALVALASLVTTYARPRLRAFIPYGVALAWVLGGLVLLSVVPEKKERYMLPLMPPLALLIAGLLRYWESRPVREWSRTDGWLLKSWGGLLAAVCAALPVALGWVSLSGFEVGTFRFMLVSLVFGGVAGGLIVHVVRGVRPVRLVGATLLVTGAVTGLLMPVYPVWEARKATASLPRMESVGGKSAYAGVSRWYSLDTMHVKQVWAAGRAVPIWHPTDSSLAALPGRVVVVAGSSIQKKLPAGWERRVRISQPDSFYLGRDEKSGYWLICRLDPI
ncbi:ArnT family glycosyltransferase [Hymenobacter sp. 102]|uniref:ArnT family glycosyltransferase n=1 Tax=Hymenobacter sp. 102 TaxID=3403152 RepID=UPI003CF81FB0